MLRKSNRQYLENQQTVLSSSDSPCQTNLKIPEIHARQLWFFLAFYLPLPWLINKAATQRLKIYQWSSLLRPMVEEIESLKDGGIGLELLDKVCPGARFQALKLVEKQSEVLWPEVSSSPCRPLWRCIKIARQEFPLVSCSLLPGPWRKSRGLQYYLRAQPVIGRKKKCLYVKLK